MYFKRMHDLRNLWWRKHGIMAAVSFATFSQIKLTKPGIKENSS